MKQKLLSLMLSLLATAPVLAARSPADTVSGFYKLRIENSSSGAPSGMELAAFSSYLAPEVVCMLGAALRYGEQYSKALPDAKAPFSDGDLYSSNTAGPSRFKLGSANLASQRGQIRINLFHDEPQEELDSKGWEDIVHLALVRKKWLITDIEYAASFPGARQGSLMSTLRDTLSHPEASSHWDARELSACEMDPMPVKGKTKGKATAKKRKPGKSTSAQVKSTKRSSKTTPQRKRSSR